MPFELQVGSILSSPWPDVIAHQTNCQGVMGSGLAAQVAQVFPGAAEADRAWQKRFNPLSKMLGTISVYQSDLGPTIINMYGQFSYGRAQRHTNYEALYRALLQLDQFVRAKSQAEGRPLVVRVPYNLGSGRGGGSWPIVKAMLDDTVGSSTSAEWCRLQIWSLYTPE